VNDRFKLIKWWAQSFLIGVPKIVCGFRDDDGIVHRLEEFKTQDIPRYCQVIPQNIPRSCQVSPQDIPSYC